MLYNLINSTNLSNFFLRTSAIAEAFCFQIPLTNKICYFKIKERTSLISFNQAQSLDWALFLFFHQFVKH